MLATSALLAALVAQAGATAAGPDTGPDTSVIHPLWVESPGAPEGSMALGRFRAAVERYRLRPLEIVDLPRPPAPRAPEALRAALPLVEKLRFDEARAALDAVAAEVDATGGAGLEPSDVADLFFARAWARQRANWRTDAAAPVAPDAFEDYLRAAVLRPERPVTPRSHPPAVVEAWKRAVAETARRPRGSVVVRAPQRAHVTLDGRPAPAPGPATFADLPYGEHRVRVEDPGHPPWAAVLPLGAPSLDVDPPPQPPLVFADADAAAHARRMGARFALVARLRAAPGPAQIDMDLVDADSGARQDGASLALGSEAAAMDAAVMRLDEEARRLELQRQRVTPQLPPSQAGPPALPAPLSAGGPAPAASGMPGAPGTTAAPPAAAPVLIQPAGAPAARFEDDPAAWARDHWPLVAVVGVMVATAVVLGAVVAGDRRR